MKPMRFPNPTFAKSYEQLDITYDSEHEAVWFKYNSMPRPCFTPTLLQDISTAQQSVIDYVRADHEHGVPLRYLVAASGVENVYNLGGDLNLFKKLIEAGDREGLRKYAYACIDVLYNNAVHLDLDLTTIALVQGSALGGGFEAALSCNVIVAEKGVDFGFPEILFNLFPGMGAYSLLARRVSQLETEKMITSGKMYTSEELFDMGIVDILAERGEGEAALHEYIRNHRRARNGLTAIQKVRQRVNPVTYEELADVTDIWVDAALNLEPRNLRLIDRLVRAQDRKKVEQPQQAQEQQPKAAEPAFSAANG